MLTSINKWIPTEFRRRFLDGATDDDVTLIRMAYISKNAHLLKYNADNPLFQQKSSAGTKSTRLRGFEPHPLEPIEFEALIRAAENDRYMIVKILIENGVDVNYTPRERTIYDTSPLFESASMGSHRAAQVLIANGADVNARVGSRAKTALFGAVYAFKQNRAPLGVSARVDDEIDRVQAEKSLLMTRLLLDNGADPSIRTNEHQTVLWHAASCGHSETIRLLLDAGASKQLEDRPTFSDGHTPLMAASFRRHDAAVGVLLENGANINACSRNESLDALALAIRGDHEMNRFRNADSSVLTIEALIDFGANVNGDSQRVPPLSHAVGWANLPACRMLLEAGADVDKCDVDSRRPLDHWMALRTDRVPPRLHPHLPGWALVEGLFDKQAMEMLHIFLHVGADPNDHDTDGNTLLHEICSCSSLRNGMRIAITTELLHHGADVDSTNASRETPLMNLCENTDIGESERLEVMRALQMHGSNMELVDDFGDTALIKACRNPTTDVQRSILLLLVNGADINKCNDDGDTPLMVVCGSRSSSLEGKIGLLDLFRRNQADLSRENCKGDNALIISLNAQVPLFAKALVARLDVEWLYDQN